MSAAGHTLASGHEVPLTGLAAGYALVYAIAWAVAGAERGLGTVCGWMMWGQLLLHLLFGLAHSVENGSAPLSGGLHAAAHPVAPVPAPDGSAPGMPIAHLVTALLCAWWVHRGEGAAFALARHVRTMLSGVLLLRPRRPLPAAPSGPAPVPDPGVRATGAPVLRHSVVRRGPPASLLT
ncbi:hypothetical protein ACFO4E_29480 [Nocardiopsis mangrovi]|uniref:Integral membrane protein n=1 Tax=Nocardiopsis mangrovi TaxID=1179818 RepID=A0ABV9E4I4_9ACTN